MSFKDYSSKLYDWLTGVLSPGVKVVGSNAQVGTDQDATWANSASANTAVNVDVAAPDPVQAEGKYLIHVYNPSTVTALSLAIKTTLASFGGSTRYGELTYASVSANSTRSFLVQGWMLGGNGRITLSNDTILGGSDGFTAKVRVTKV